MEDSEAKPRPRAGRLRRATAAGRVDESQESFRARRALEESPVQLGVQIPRRLSLRLDYLLYQLAVEGVDLSKKDLVKMALELLPEEVTPEFLLGVERKP